MGECWFEQSRENVVGECLVLVWVGYYRHPHRRQIRFAEYQIYHSGCDRRLMVVNQLHGWDGCQGWVGVKPNVDWVASV